MSRNAVIVVTVSPPAADRLRADPTSVDARRDVEVLADAALRVHGLRAVTWPDGWLYVARNAPGLPDLTDPGSDAAARLLYGDTAVNMAVESAAEPGCVVALTHVNVIAWGEG